MSSYDELNKKAPPFLMELFICHILERDAIVVVVNRISCQINNGSSC